MSWNDLTDRQKLLDRKIDSCGIKLDGSAGCLRNVMRAIGAQNDEADYVASRITLRLKTQSLIGQVDEEVSKTENMLKQFEEDDKEWERRGRTLGFNFWDK